MIYLGMYGDVLKSFGEGGLKKTTQLIKTIIENEEWPKH